VFRYQLLRQLSEVSCSPNSENRSRFSLKKSID